MTKNNMETNRRYIFIIVLIYFIQSDDKIHAYESNDSQNGLIFTDNVNGSRYLYWIQFEMLNNLVLFSHPAVQAVGQVPSWGQAGQEGEAQGSRRRQGWGKGMNNE